MFAFLQNADARQQQDGDEKFMALDKLYQAAKSGELFLIELFHKHYVQIPHNHIIYANNQASGSRSNSDGRSTGPKQFSLLPHRALRVPFLDITREALTKFVKSRGDANGAVTFEGACDQLGIRFVRKNGWIPTGFFQYNGIGLGNGLYRRIRKDEGRAKAEPFVERVTEEVHKHHSSHSAATIASYKGWRVPNMSADDPGQHAIHSLYYCTAAHELDANLLRSVLGTLVSLDGSSAGPVQEAYAILLMSLADNGELWDDKVETRLKSGVSSHHAGGLTKICDRLTSVDGVGAWLDAHLGDPNVLALVIAALSWGTPQRNDGGRQRRGVRVANRE